MAGNKPSKQRKLDPDSPEMKYLKNRDAYEFFGAKWLLKPLPDKPSTYRALVWTVTLIAAVVRFQNLPYPREVVFDEVHFGKFASYYLERTYFFDVHPPFAKMLIAFVGWLVGYNGAFKFEDIGMSYDTNPAPFVAYRSLSAILGTLTVPIVFNTVKELNFRAVTCTLAAMLVAVDCAQVIDSRLILLDATLIIAVACSIYCYVRFYKTQLQTPFSSQWYLWLYATGISLSFVMSTKYIGVMTYSAIGAAVVANLWQLLDFKAGVSIRLFAKHFVQRLNGLIFAPFMVYLFWFWVHFAILTRSGPGDDFMSPQFQQTLSDSPLAKEARQVNYYDIVTLKHKGTEALLHSHQERYPLRYEDGRISSNGQQVTGYRYEDVNNQWEVLPTKELPGREGQPVHLDDVVRFKHVVTGTYLLAHDVASPLYPTNEEVTTVEEEAANGNNYHETLFSLQSANKGDTKDVLKTKLSVFRIVHTDTNVALWTHNDVLLPEWGFKQQEVNGNKKVIDPENSWFMDTIINIDDARKVYVPKPVEKLPFFAKWSELQKLMFEHNNKLSSDHPFASNPESWPGSLSGVSFWTKDQERKQIYFIGNIVGWWFQVISLALFSGLTIADIIARRRGIYPLNKMARQKLHAPLSFLFIAWLCHYLPFFLMGRQKFLHHYLPAHLIASMFSAALWETVFTENKSLNMDIDEEDPVNPHDASPKLKFIPLCLFCSAVIVALIWCFAFFSPIIYGNESLTVPQVKSREWLNIKLHFSK
ncbi:Dolichyl-phosphate-mannose--protein mannosyltransferase [Lachancea thermotolerans]|uniref:Dolichyl-phosphate-mannose--protein mannosyltransferase n=1 Tax=Lachancea thermotolerans (strain ATCC 56472 / CBS 6340 / NRRL Y-8284) TaxID=559295 RepID=C5DFR6_LACTC|nr:KLTH0D17336p [Lachancea thermotolerans CBS 6340]CAR23021.1 KLTH0D17336p [Lachancea thermotolerans CBS 6340]